MQVGGLWLILPAGLKFKVPRECRCKKVLDSEGATMDKQIVEVLVLNLECQSEPTRVCVKFLEF